MAKFPYTTLSTWKQEPAVTDDFSTIPLDPKFVVVEHVGAAKAPDAIPAAITPAHKTLLQPISRSKNKTCPKVELASLMPKPKFLKWRHFQLPKR
jgi:hypothetical protein